MVNRMARRAGWDKITWVRFFFKLKVGITLDPLILLFLIAAFFPAKVRVKRETLKKDRCVLCKALGSFWMSLEESLTHTVRGASQFSIDALPSFLPRLESVSRSRLSCQWCFQPPATTRKKGLLSLMYANWNPMTLTTTNDDERTTKKKKDLMRGLYF